MVWWSCPGTACGGSFPARHTTFPSTLRARPSPPRTRCVRLPVVLDTPLRCTPQQALGPGRSATLTGRIYVSKNILEHLAGRYRSTVPLDYGWYAFAMVLIPCRHEACVVDASLAVLPPLRAVPVLPVSPIPHRKSPVWRILRSSAASFIISFFVVRAPWACGPLLRTAVVSGTCRYVLQTDCEGTSAAESFLSATVRTPLRKTTLKSVRGWFARYWFVYDV